MPVSVIPSADQYSQAAGIQAGQAFTSGLFGAIQKRRMRADYLPVAEATIASHPIAANLPDDQRARLIESTADIYTDLALQGRLSDVGAIFDPFNEGTLRGAQTEANYALGRERDAGANASNAMAGYRHQQEITEREKRPVVIDELRSRADENRAQAGVSNARERLLGTQNESALKDIFARAVLNAARVGETESRTRLNDERSQTEVVRRDRPNDQRNAATPAQGASIMGSVSDDLLDLADALRASMGEDKPGFWGHVGNVMWPGQPFSETSEQTESLRSEALAQANMILPQLGLPPLPETASKDEILSAIDRIRATLSSQRLGRAMLPGSQPAAASNDAGQMTDEELLRQLNIK